jgi:hypothetical protein
MLIQQQLIPEQNKIVYEIMGIDNAALQATA